MYSYSAEFLNLETALQSHWTPFQMLAGEMLAFEPRTIGDYQAERIAELSRLSALNPDSSEGSLAQIVDDQIAARARPDIQFYLRFRDRFMTEYITVVLLSHALCEAAINAILAIGLASIGTPEKFEKIERKSVNEKWRNGPRSFAPSYELRSDSPLCESLEHLTTQRNALVHYKVKLEVHGKEVLSGSGFRNRPYADEVPWVRRFFSLPYDLAHHARSNIPSPPTMILTRSGPIERSVAHGEA